MAEQEHPRFSEMAPRIVSIPDTWGHVPVGPIEQADVYDSDGIRVGYVWTDGHEAAGFLEYEEAGLAGRKADSRIWKLQADAHVRGVPASQALDPQLYAPDFRLGSPS